MVRDQVPARRLPINKQVTAFGRWMVCETSCKAVVATEVLEALWKRAVCVRENGCEVQDPRMRDRVCEHHSCETGKDCVRN